MIRFVSRTNSPTEVNATTVVSPAFDYGYHDFLIAVVNHQGATISAVDTSSGETFFKSANSPLADADGVNYQSIYYWPGGVSGATGATATAHFGGTYAHATITVYRFEADDLMDVVDVFTGSDSTGTGTSSTAIDAGAIALDPERYCAVVACIFSGNPPVPSSGHTQAQADSSGNVYDSFRILDLGETSEQVIAVGNGSAWGIIALAFAQAAPVSAAVNPSIEYLVVGGGGAGGGGTDGDGGGGGGGVEHGTLTLPASPVTVTIGAGGAGAAGTGGDGAASVFGSITAAGGGGGGSGANGRSGGSGGGGSTGGGTGGAATATEGHTGGAGSAGTGASTGGGGGGGAGAVGGAGSAAAGGTGGAGGAGYSSSITGAAVSYGGGGGGCGWAVNGAGGAGGGGAAGVAGTANTGGGGGSVHGGNGKNGGSGKVILRYLTGTLISTSGTVTTDGAYTVHTFDATGSFTWAPAPNVSLLAMLF